MKVLHIINNLGSGGAEKFLEYLIPLMNKIENMEVDILLLTDKNNVFHESLISKAVKVDVVKYKNMYDFRNIFEIKRHVVYGNYDIVHSHLFPTQYLVALSRILIGNKKIKFVTTEHSTHNRRREKFYFRYIDKFIYSKYNKIISISEKTRDSLLAWIDPKHEQSDKHVIIANGVDVERIKVASPYKKSELIEGINEYTKLICMVGRFSEPKDQSTLIKAINELPDDIHLLLVGEGPLLSNSKKLAIKLGISDKIHFLGFRQDIPRILKTVDIVVLSSIWEGFGLAAVEGMAAEKPVIVSNAEGLIEVVDDKELQFPIKDYESLADKIVMLIDDKDKYKEKVDYAKQKCLGYSIDKYILEVLSFYINLLKQ